MNIVDLGASGLSSKTNVMWSQCKDSPIDEEDAADYGRSIIMNCLGVWALPAPKTAAGAAQGVVAEVAGTDGVCIGAYDPRTSKVAGEISPGETAFGATGKDFDSRMLAKNQLLSLLVGDDHTVTIDRKNKQIMINCPGGSIKVCANDGVVLSDSSGKSSIQLKGDFAGILGSVVLGGRTPYSKVADAKLVDIEIRKLWTFLAGVPGSTVDELKTAAATASLSVLPTKSGVNLGK